MEKPHHREMQWQVSTGEEKAWSQQTLLRLTVLVYIFTLLNKFFTSDKNMEYHAAFLTQQTEVLVP